MIGLDLRRPRYLGLAECSRREDLGAVRHPPRRRAGQVASIRATEPADLQDLLKPSVGLEPTAASLPWRFWSGKRGHLQTLAEDYLPANRLLRECRSCPRVTAPEQVCVPVWYPRAVGLSDNERRWRLFPGAPQPTCRARNLPQDLSPSLVVARASAKPSMRDPAAVIGRVVTQRQT